MRTYTEEQVISILDHIERNGFNDDCMTMNEELEYLNSIGVVKNCSIPNVVGQSEQLCQHEWHKHPSHPKIGAMLCRKCGAELA